MRPSGVHAEECVGPLPALNRTLGSAGGGRTDRLTKRVRHPLPSRCHEGMKNKVAAALALLGVLAAVGCSASQEPAPVLTSGVLVTEVGEPVQGEDGSQTTFITSPDAASMSKAEIERTVRDAYRSRILEGGSAPAGGIRPQMAEGESGGWCGYAILSCGRNCFQSFYCCGSTIRICWASPS